MNDVPDPYRVLGLSPDASPDDIKRAYRRLAKQYHPDSAGDAAMARFLVVQSAYESLVATWARGRASSRRATARPAPGARPGGMSGQRTTDAAGSSRGPAWEADPERARATRDAYARARTGRTPGADGSPSWRRGRGGTAAGKAADGPTPGGAGTSGTATSGNGASGASRTGARAGEGAPHRSVRKAHLGSTSYDDAESRDPQWQGATWYGPASGTYWTINPKEYADPRKHGPEYQARGRRSVAGEERPETTGAGDERPMQPGPAAQVDPSDPGPGPSATTAPGTDAGAAAASIRWRDHPAAASRAGSPGLGGAGASSATPRPPSAGAFSTTSASRAPDDAAPSRSGSRPAATVGGGLRPTSTAAGDRVASASLRRAAMAPDASGSSAARDGLALPRLPIPPRIFVALIAWPVLGLAAAGLIGQLTGCARFSASCSAGLDLAPVILQPVILGILIALPRLAEIAAVGSAAVVVAALPATVLLSASGGARAPAGEAPAALFAILAISWLVGVAAALSGRARLPAVLRGR